MNNESMVQIESNDSVQEVSIEQLLGFNLNQVEEVRGFPLTPAGIYEWRIKGWSNKQVNWEVTKGASDTARSSMVLECLMEAIACRQCKNPEVDITTLVGLEFTEGFFLAKAEDLGRVKAFFVDIGMKGEGTIQDLCDQSTGVEFVGSITHRKDKNDTAKTYANLDRNAIGPLVSGDITATIVETSAAIAIPEKSATAGLKL